MSEPRWIVIHNWDRYQHYNDRRPVWIKLYTELLGNPRYCALTLTQRGILSGLLLMYAESDAEIPLDTAWLSRRLNGRITNAQLKGLNHAGFIEFSASKPLAPRYQGASPRARREETERETDTRERKEQKQKQEPAKPAVASYDGLAPLDFNATLTTANGQAGNESHTHHQQPPQPDQWGTPA